MKKRTPRRNAAAGIALALVTFAIGLALAVLVAGSASAKTSPKTAHKKAAPKSHKGLAPSAALAPADKFSAINGTVNAASDHEIVGSSAFPNFTTGAVDNYYSLAHSHVDNSPFAEGTASPFDTGPVGQTAAAGNTQQPQYADARWPGGPDKATYGNEGGPYATSAAGNNRATADGSEPSNSFRGPGPGGTDTLAVPKGFDELLQKALAAWNSKWDGRLGIANPAAPKGSTPVPSVTVPSAPVKPPSVTTPPLPVGGVNAPSVTVPTPNFASAGPKDGSRSPAAVTLPQPPASLPALPGSGSAPSAGGKESSLKSSTLATLVYKTDKPDTSENNTCKTATVGTTGTTGTTGTATPTTTTTKVEKPKSGSCTLVLSGESSVGKVSIGDGQIVIEGIHVTASITNDGKNRSYKAAVSVASATIGGIPVTIDEDGVHINGQGGGLPYKQASDGLNSALNKAGIEIFLVAPEVTDCSQTGSGTGSGTSTTTTTTSTTSSPSQSGGASSCGQSNTGTGTSSSCDQSSSSSNSGGAGGLPAPPTSAPTPTPSNNTSTTSSPCGPSDMGASCDQTGTGNSNTGSSGGAPALPGTSTTTKTTTTTTTTTNRSSTTATPTSSCDQSGTAPSTSMCTKGGKGTGTNNQSATTSTNGSSDSSSNTTFQFGPGPGTNNEGEETVTATGVHIVFTQPVSPPGVPAQYAEHILGEVFVDSLATPATPLGKIPFALGSSGSSLSSSSCLGGSGGGRLGSGTSGGGLSAGGSSSGVAGSTASGGGGSLTAASGGLGSSSQPNGASTGSSLPARFASALHKPLWLLLAYVVWQVLVLGTGWSLWNWRRGGPA